MSSFWEPYGHGEASLFVFGSALHLLIISPAITFAKGAYDLKSDNDIMEMKVGGALFITVSMIHNCKENVRLFPIDRERPLNRAEGRTS